MRDYSTL